MGSGKFRSNWLACIFAGALTVSSVMIPSVSAQGTQQSEQAAANLRKSILDTIARLPQGSTSQVYAAQIALVVDSALQTGTAAGNIPGLTQANANCIVVLRALDGAIGETVERNARRALIDLRANLRACNAGTGAGTGLTTGFDYALPGVNVGGGSDYAQ